MNESLFQTTQIHR